MRFPLALAFLPACAAFAQAAIPPLDPWSPATQAVLIQPPPAPRPEGTKTLLRWRKAHALRSAADEEAEATALRDALERPPPGPSAALAALERALAARQSFLELLRADAATVVDFPRGEGPESPMEDGPLLRHGAADRMLAVRVALARGETSRAVDEALALLHFSRAILEGQESILGCVVALGVTSVALEAVEDVFDYVPSAESDRLWQVLYGSWEGLLVRAYRNALRGEFHHVFRRIVARMPETTSPLDLLDAIAKMGIPGTRDEPHAGVDFLAPIVNPLLDRTETEHLYAAVVSPYLLLLESGTLPPRGAYERHRRHFVDGFAAEFGPLNELFLGEPDAARMRSRATIWRRLLETVPNPMGKLLVQLNLPDAESLAESLMRREAARRILLARELLRRRRSPQWPEDLSAVPTSLRTDPFTGGVLRYDPGRDRIWSAGPNRRDDDGTSDERRPVLSPDLVWTLKPRTIQ